MSNLTPRQLQAVSKLASGKTIAQTANELSIGTKTVQRWKEKPGFMDALEKVRVKSVEVAIEQTAHDIAKEVKSMVPKAIKVLNQYLDNEGAHYNARLRACQLVGNWAGLNQSQNDDKTAPELNLKDYLEYLASKNGANKN
jgi:hypothetical protein